MATRKYVKCCIACRLAAHSEIAESGCHIWTGTKNRKGYGQLNVAGRREGAHRVAYASLHGPIPAGMFVMHSCDTPSCVNPAHLSLGTPADNMADKVRKGRQQRGELVPCAALNRTQVEAIRRDARTHKAIATEYGVARATIGDIKNLRTWRPQ